MYCQRSKHVAPPGSTPECLKARSDPEPQQVMDFERHRLNAESIGNALCGVPHKRADGAGFAAMAAHGFQASGGSAGLGGRYAREVLPDTRAYDPASVRGRLWLFLKSQNGISRWALNGLPGMQIVCALTVAEYAVNATGKTLRPVLLWQGWAGFCKPIVRRSIFFHDRDHHMLNRVAHLRMVDGEMDGGHIAL